MTDPRPRPGGAPPSSTRSTCAASPTATATAIGDLPGLRSRIPYLRDLGVDAVWVTPWYPSPMADGGYDVADYCDIDPVFGTLADAERCRRGPRSRPAAHRRPRRQPLAPSRTRGSRRRSRPAPGSPERARYFFRDGPRRTACAAERLDQRLRRPGLDAGHRAGRAPGPVVPAHCSPPSSPTSTGSTRGAGRVRPTSALLARPRRRRLPRRRRPAMAKAPGLPTPARARRAVRVQPWVDSPQWDVDEVHDDPAPLAPARRRLRRRPAVRRPRPWSTAPSGSAATCGPDEMHTSFNFEFLKAPVGRRRAARGHRHDAGRAGRGRRAGDLGAVQPRRDAARHPLRPRGTPGRHDGLRRRRHADRRRARHAAGPARPRCSCSRCPAAPTSTRARSSACPRWRTSRRSCCRTRRGSAPGDGPRPGRLPGAAALERRRAAVRLLPGRRRSPWLPQPAGLGAAHRRGAGGRPGVDAGAVPRGLRLRRTHA